MLCESNPGHGRTPLVADGVHSTETDVVAQALPIGGDPLPVDLPPACLLITEIGPHHQILIVHRVVGHSGLKLVAGGRPGADSERLARWALNHHRDRTPANLGP